MSEENRNQIEREEYVEGLASMLDEYRSQIGREEYAEERATQAWCALPDMPRDVITSLRKGKIDSEKIEKLFKANAKKILLEAYKIPESDVNRIIEEETFDNYPEILQMKNQMTWAVEIVEEILGNRSIYRGNGYLEDIKISPNASYTGIVKILLTFYEKLSKENEDKYLPVPGEVIGVNEMKKHIEFITSILKCVQIEREGEEIDIDIGKIETCYNEVVRQFIITNGIRKPEDLARYMTNKKSAKSNGDLETLEDVDEQDKKIVETLEEREPGKIESIRASVILQLFQDDSRGVGRLQEYLTEEDKLFAEQLMLNDIESILQQRNGIRDAFKEIQNGQTTDIRIGILSKLSTRLKGKIKQMQNEYNEEYDFGLEFCEGVDVERQDFEVVSDEDGKEERVDDLFAQEDKVLNALCSLNFATKGKDSIAKLCVLMMYRKSIKDETERLQELYDSKDNSNLEEI